MDLVKGKVPKNANEIKILALHILLARTLDFLRNLVL